MTMRLTIKGVISAISLVSLGILLTLLVEFALVKYLDEPRLDEKSPKKWVLDYTAEQQAKMGISCKDLGAIVKKVVQESFQPVLAARASGENWKHLVSPPDQERLAQTGFIITRCWNVFDAGEKGRLNGLESIHFVDQLVIDYAKFRIQLYGAPSFCVSQLCTDTSFEELRKSYIALLELLESKVPG